jgi:ribonucleoside-diphosphate reductase alpha chain
MPAKRKRFTEFGRKEMDNWWWVNEDTQTFMSRGYLRPGETVQERSWAIANRAGQILGDPEFAVKFYHYLSRGYYSLASPVWSNFGRSGLPISCNNVYVDDTIHDILMKTAEIGMQTKNGAGTSAYLGAIRPRGSRINTGGVADGPAHFAQLIDSTTEVISQGAVRRGSCAVYLDVDHPDILEFLEFREINSVVKNLSLGVCISDSWMESMLAGDPDKRKVWSRIIRKRVESGYPYLFFTDTVNRAAPQPYKDLGRRIYSSNLCSEITLSSSVDESFVCDLSSLNLVTRDEWVYTDAVEMLVSFLDAVMSEYIDKTEAMPLMANARRFAINQRALGLGVLGWHSYLQKLSIPFESKEALELNIVVHKEISERALAQSEKLAKTLGEPPMLKGYGRRNMTLMAIAPTTSSSFILGQVSPSIEPLASNYFVKNLAKGNFTYKNPYLKEVLRAHGKDDKETWSSILEHAGSVQHLDWLSAHERKVFKTFAEIPQIAVVQQAADRQNFIDQAQSLNLMIPPDTPPKDISKLLITGWNLGVKTFYYQRSANPAQELARDILNCESCSA